jgi:hypothetical protein
LSFFAVRVLSVRADLLTSGFLTSDFKAGERKKKKMSSAA